jgi:hypothetical protein
LTTRAVHCEDVYDLSTNSVINALERLIARRGFPKIIYSDNAANFVKSSAQLKQLYIHLDWGRVQKHFITNVPDPIEWKFSSPLAPHQGGGWESLVRTFKNAMKSIMANKKATEEEFHTCVVASEGILNARPLTMVTSDTGDVLPLSPFHLCAGRGLLQLPDYLARDQWQQPLAVRWRQRQHLKNAFWQCWIKLYLKEQMCSKKWHLRQNAPKVGQIVIVNDGSTSRSQWPLARVESLVVGRDGLVRSAILKRCGTDTPIRRAIHYIYRFEAEEDADIPQTVAALEMFLAAQMKEEEKLIPAGGAEASAVTGAVTSHSAAQSS